LARTSVIVSGVLVHSNASVEDMIIFSHYDIGRRIREIAAQGITEIIYQPTGPDIPAELEAFHTAARSATSAA
jgi:hypothetical protein